MVKKLFVGGILYEAKDTDVREAFSQCGEVVSVTLLKNPATHQPAGYGFVEMASEEEAEKAIQTWNDVVFMGRKLTVNYALPKKERPAHPEASNTF